MSALLIETRGLTKSFGPKQVLAGVDLAVGQGQSLCVIGQSGTGKSILLKCILGLVEPDAGEVLWQGQRLTPARRRDFLSGFGMLFQGAALFDSAPPRAMQAAEAAAVFVGNGAVKAQPPYPPEVIGVPVDHTQHDWLQRRQTPMPWRCFADPLPPLPSRFHALPKTYVLALGNRLAGPRQGAAEARALGWPMPQIDSGHMLMVTAVDETVEALLTLA